MNQLRLLQSGTFMVEDEGLVLAHGRQSALLQNSMEQQLLWADEVISKSLTIPWSHDIHVQLPTVACRPRKKLVMRTGAMAVFPFAACFI